MSKYVSKIEKLKPVKCAEVGNKAFNLQKISELDYVKIPLSIVFNIHDAKEDEEALNDLLLEVRNRFKYPIIVRSSSSVEDSDSSFAGQFLSMVCANEQELVENVSKILYCVDSENIKEYCRFHGIDFKTIKMAVLVQQYLVPQFAGVLFTKHPVLSIDDMYTEYKANSSDAVTSGESKVISQLLPRRGAIDDVYFKQLRDIAISAENYFGYPLDIEWIVSDDKLWIVQVRKITS